MGKLSALNVLKEKLGEDGVNALLEVVEEERRRTREDLFQVLEERFARRLAEEIGKLRAEVHKEIAKVWNEIGKLRAEMQGMRADIIKWMFIFWVSQLLALSGIIFTILRFVR